MAGVSQSETFSFTWKIENIHLSNRRLNAYLRTPVFRVGLFENTSWQLLFAPAGIGEPSFWGCSLRRADSEKEAEILKIRWKIYLIAEGGTVRFETHVDSIFPGCKTEEVPQFIRRSELLPTDTPQNSLTIYCEMTNDSLYSSKVDLAYDFETLSSDLAALLESGFRSDFKMYCRGEIFNVHKFILLSRWPEFCKRFEIGDIATRNDIIVTGVEPSTLYAYLTLLYSGKLQRRDISVELCSYLHEQMCDTLMTSLETPASHLEFVTYTIYEQKHLTWEVGDDKIWETNEVPFYRVIPLEVIYPREMVIIFNFARRNSEEWLRLGVLFTELIEIRPLLLDGEISFVNKNAVVCSRKFHHLLQFGEEWFFPDIVKKSDLFPNERNSKYIEISLYLSDGTVDSRQVSSTINNASRFHEVKDLRKLRMDLMNSSCKKDLKLKIGDFRTKVHSVVVAARSEKFREFIQQNGNFIEIEESLSRKEIVLLVNHLYGGRLQNLDTRSAIALNTVAKKYSLTSLEEKTRKFLDGNAF
ncbi:Speckle-type POZ protein-like like protein [Argiope bruennichi]|uniref:Speckle-type POZ protein-like like protein n=1 Tax=Argiope bruennichi TaxID=94029 RepID=A0A8T0ESQ8_ARGBR|nr:Speckle-type POZ protein-like like protein [Argiope bruennichi]